MICEGKHSWNFPNYIRKHLRKVYSKRIKLVMYKSLSLTTRKYESDIKDGSPDCNWNGRLVIYDENKNYVIGSLRFLLTHFQYRHGLNM